MDLEYIIKSEILEGIRYEDIAWRGASVSNIVYDGNIKRWKVSSILANETLATMDLVVS